MNLSDKESVSTRQCCVKYKEERSIWSPHGGWFNLPDHRDHVNRVDNLCQSWMAPAECLLFWHNLLCNGWLASRLMVDNPAHITVISWSFPPLKHPIKLPLKTQRTGRSAALFTALSLAHNILPHRTSHFCLRIPTKVDLRLWSFLFFNVMWLAAVRKPPK